MTLERSSTVRRTLAVFAHPDDESYGCAGALAREGARSDAATALLCLTSGEASSMGPARGLSREEVAALREERMHRVAEILRVSSLRFGHLPDGRLARLPLDELVAPINAALDAFAPDVVITHCARGVNGHADHVATHWAVRMALEKRPDVRLALVAYTTATRDALAPRLLFATADDEIDVSLTLDEAELEAKEACLRIHEALVTLRADGPEHLLRRPPIEHYDLFGGDLSPAATDLFHGRTPTA